MSATSTQSSEFVVSYLTLRQMIGWAGLLMPVAVRLGAWIFEGIHTTDSISAYYYTGMRDVFVSTLVVGGALIACYRTPAMLDNVVATVAGVAAIGIGLFPMAPVYAPEILRKYPRMSDVIAQCYFGRGLVGYHFIFVTTFFTLSCYLVLRRFRAFTPPVPTEQKRLRNKIYAVCGVIMLVAFATIGFLALTDRGGSIFWPEAGAVIAFSVAWLVKGQTYFRLIKDPA